MTEADKKEIKIGSKIEGLGIITVINYEECFMQFRNSAGNYFSKTFKELAEHEYFGSR
jgi:hypothetical protein